MAFSPYSQPVKPAEWVDPMDLNLYAKNMMYKQQMAEKNIQDISALHNSLMSIPAYGPDKQKLVEKEQELKNAVSSMDLSNIGDINTAAKIKGTIGQYSTDPDILAIAKRGSAYSQMLQEKKEIEAKGKVYVNRGIKQLGNYFSQKDYKQDLPFGNDGYQAPDAAEMMEKAKKIITPDEKRVLMPNGQYELVKYYDPAKLTQAIKTIAESNPNWHKYHRDNIEDEFDGVDVNQYATQQYTDLLNTYQNHYDAAAQILTTAKDPADIAKAKKDMSEAEEGLTKTKEHLTNPYLGQSFKNEKLANNKNNDILNMARAMSFAQEGETKMDMAHQKSMELSNDLYKEKYKTMLAALPYLSDQDQQKVMAGNISNIDLHQLAEAKKQEKEQKEKDVVRNQRLIRASDAGYDIIDPTTGGYISNQKLDELDLKKAQKATPLKYSETDNKIKNSIESFAKDASPTEAQIKTVQSQIIDNYKKLGFSSAPSPDEITSEDGKIKIKHKPHSWSKEETKVYNSDKLLEKLQIAPIKTPSDKTPSDKTPTDNKLEFGI